MIFYQDMPNLHNRYKVLVRKHSRTLFSKGTGQWPSTDDIRQTMATAHVAIMNG